MSGAEGGGSTGGAGVLTVTRAVEVAEPPGPLAVMVYVVESSGVTLVEPSALTVPTSGAMGSCVGLGEVQLNVDASPLLTEVGSPESGTGGWAGAGAGGG